VVEIPASQRQISR